MNESQEDGLTLEWKPAARNGEITVIAKLHDEVLEMDTFDVTKSRARDRFVARVCDGRPGIEKDEVEAKLRDLAVGLADRSLGGSLEAPNQREIDARRIIRPERFITPAVSGVNRTFDTSTDRLVDVEEVAERLKCSTRQVYRLADAGRMPRPVKLGALTRWPFNELQAWIAQRCPRYDRRAAVR